LRGFVGERPPACLGDLHVRDFDRASADNHALGMCGRQPGAHQLDYPVDRETMREQDRLGTAKAAGSLRGNLLLRPVELGSVDPYAVQNYRELARDDCGLSPKTPTLLDVLWVRGRLKLQNQERSLPRVLDSNLRVTASPTRVYRWGWHHVKAKSCH
jgi:hypothetical protein